MIRQKACCSSERKLFLKCKENHRVTHREYTKGRWRKKVSKRVERVWWCSRKEHWVKVSVLKWPVNSFRENIKMTWQEKIKYIKMWQENNKIEMSSKYRKHEQILMQRLQSQTDRVGTYVDPKHRVFSVTVVALC